MGGLFGGGNNSTTYTPMVNSLRVQTSCFGRPIPVLFGQNRLSGNLLWYGDFTAIPHSSTQSSGGKGGGGGSQTTITYTYTTALILALCEGPGVAVGRIWKGKEVFPNVASKFNGGVFLGTYPTQSPWAYLVSKHPGQDLGYQGIVYVAGAPYDLASQPDLGEHSFEVTGFNPFNLGAGIPDADPSVVLNIGLTNLNFGAGFPVSQIGDWTQFSNYVVANGLFISPLWESQQPASQTFDEICQGVNCEFVFSEGLLKVIPYGDVAITGNGRTFTPNITPVYDVGDDDYIPTKGNDPVEMARTDPADAFNDIKVEYVDRTTNYAPAVVEAMDQAGIELAGTARSANNLKFNWICDTTIAQKVAQLALQRLLYVRNIYSFSLGWRFAVLEPMDLITITDSVLGLNKLIVRIKTIEEDENGNLMFTAEDALLGTKNPALFNTSTGLGYVTDYNVPPGPVNVPLIFDAPGILTTSGYEVWAAVAGGSNWGGASVFASLDNATFKQAGVINGNSRYGVTISTLASGVDPDLTHTFDVDLSISTGQLTGGSQADADQLTTIAMVDSEFITFQAATLIGSNQYTVGPYLRRGVYNSPISSHSVGAKFVRLDQALFKFAYDPSLLGKTIYFKFVSFNHYNGASEDLSTVATYSYVIGGSRSFPSNVQQFAVSQTGYTTVFTWQQVPDPNLLGYEIRYQSAGTPNWDLATPLTSITKGTQITTSKIPPGSWIFLIKAVDASKKYSPLATTAAAVLLSDSVVFFMAQQDGFWTGLNSVNTPYWTADGNLMWNADPTTKMWTAGNFIKHWTGALVPDSQVLASDATSSPNGVGWATFDTAVPQPYLNCTYDTPECDLYADGNSRFYLPFSAEAMPGQTTTAISVATFADNRLATGTYAGFQPWTSGQMPGRYARARITMDNTVCTGVIRTFAAKADAPLHQENFTNVPVSAAGTAFIYSVPYRLLPTVTGNSVNGDGGSVGFDLQLTSSSRAKVFVGGIPVASVINASAIGV